MENKFESALDAAAIAQILEQHKAWIASNRRKGCQANLNGANLNNANLGGACLIGANLRNANLRSANLGNADLSSANLRCSDLSDAELRGTNLRCSNLSYALLLNADLSGANLHGAYLHGAYLHRANLSGADLRRVNLAHAALINTNLRGALGFSVLADAPQRLLDVARAALAQESALDMETWHRCETTHCIAGWAIHQAGMKGLDLERRYGPEVAGRMLLGHEAAMHFHDHDIDARAWLQSVLDAAEPDQSAPAANS